MTVQVPRRAASVALTTIGMLLLSAAPAAAYIGPGAGLSAIGTLLALVAALGLAVVGFVWFPLKRLLRRSRPATGRQLPDDTPK